MNDLLNDPKAIAITLLGALVAVLTFLGKDVLKRLKELERNSVDKNYVDTRHHENTGRFDALGRRFDKLEDVVTQAVTGTHRRIDDLYRDLMGKDS